MAVIDRDALAAADLSSGDFVAIEGAPWDGGHDRTPGSVNHIRISKTVVRVTDERHRFGAPNQPKRLHHSRGRMAPESSIGAPFRYLIEAIRDRAAVNTTFGDPVKRGGRTVVTVARVAYGLGGSFGDGAEATNEDEWAVESGGPQLIRSASETYSSHRLL
ncbi:MAG: hypothetical protein ACI9PP_000830 [Halobacteriales archaeon]|jgi:hypothetical protein